MVDVGDMLLLLLDVVLLLGSLRDLFELKYCVSECVRDKILACISDIGRVGR